MKSLSVTLGNARRFVEFIFGLLFCKSLKVTEVRTTDRLIFTPLRGVENCWVDYYLAVRFSKVANVEVVLMSPFSIPFGNAESCTSYKVRIFLIGQIIKHRLIRFVLYIRSVKYVVVDQLPKRPSIPSAVVRGSLDEFYRRFYGDRDYKCGLRSDKHGDTLDQFQSLYNFAASNYKPSDILVSSHGIYEWAVCYRLFRNMGARTYIWGANIYNSQILRFSRQPLQVGDPLGDINADCLLDMDARLRGVAVDQPTQWKADLDPSISSFVRSYKRVVLLTPNCLWDGDTDIRDSIYKGVLDWIEKTINFSSDKSGLGVIIRVHPAEGSQWASRPSLWDVLSEESLPANCLVVAPHDGSSTLAISELADATVFYSGMVGVEAASLGHDVICVSNSINGKVKGVLQVATVEEYHQLLVGGDVGQTCSANGYLSVTDLFSRGIRIAHHPGSSVTAYTNPKIRGYYAQPKLDDFFIQRVIESH